jgi:predicted Zn-dependent peptidase
MHKVPIVDITVLIGAGAVRDSQAAPGMATFTATMLQQGAGSRSALDIADQTAYLGAQLATRATNDWAIVTLHVPRRQLDSALALVSDIIRRPSFADSEITRQRELRRTGLLQLKDQPTAQAPIAFNAIVYGSAHPYGWPMGGTDASLATLDRAHVQAFYDAYYRPSNTRILVVGDIGPAESYRMIDARFGSWSGGRVAAVRAPRVPEAGPRTIYLVDKPGAAQSVIRIGHVGVPRSTPDYYALAVMNAILGGPFSSRLNQNLRETHGYTYGAGSGFAMRRFAGPFTASASVVTAKTDSSLLEFMKELRRIRDDAVPPEEVAKAKSYLTLGQPSDFETTQGTASQFLDLLSNDLPLTTWSTYMARISAVTPADVQRVARRYIDPDHFAIVVVGDRSQIESGIRALNEGPISLRDLWGQEVH